MHLYKGPVLYLSGDKEKQIPIEEMQHIFAAIGSADKTLHVFKGAAHQDFFKYDASAFSKVLSVFLQSKLSRL
jgi:alpha-beta hydrolase superfamily lysophospholipase